MKKQAVLRNLKKQNKTIQSSIQDRKINTPRRLHENNIIKDLNEDFRLR